MRTILLLIMIFFSTFLFAQFSGGHRTIGANLIHCSSENDDGEYSVETSGIGLKYQYYFNKKWVLEPCVAICFPEKENGVKMYTTFETSLNLQYRFTIFDKFQVYPVAGMAFVCYKTKIQHYGEEPYETTSSFTEFVPLSIGGGVAYQLTPELQVNADVRYQSLDLWDRDVYSLGINYLF